ncbi:MAG: HNH endonuclease [Bacteroidetes bacterium]|nr:HNH endonuclease [Bacteroidota bacterium]
MPYKDKEKQKEFQRNWMRKRRAEWFNENGPCVQCGSNEDLHIDHIDPFYKISHRIWSWTKRKRDSELSKCQVLCKRCHIKKGIVNGDNFNTIGAVLSENDILEIKQLLKSLTLTKKEIGLMYGVDHSTISDISRGKSWEWVN